MRRGLTVVLAALVVLALTIPEAEARGGGHRGGGSHRSYHKARTTHVHIHVPRAAKSKSASASSAKSSTRAKTARGPVGSPPPIDCTRPNLTADEIAFCQASSQSGGVGKPPAGR